MDSWTLSATAGSALVQHSQATPSSELASKISERVSEKAETAKGFQARYELRRPGSTSHKPHAQTALIDVIDLDPTNGLP